MMSNINPHCRCERKTTTCALPCGDIDDSKKKCIAEEKNPCRNIPTLQLSASNEVEVYKPHTLN